jgi:hypothetical protein
MEWLRKLRILIRRFKRKWRRPRLSRQEKIALIKKLKAQKKAHIWENFS